MKSTIFVIWHLIKSLVALGIILGMLSVASTAFQTIVVVGIALIYTTLVSYLAMSAITQILSEFKATNRFILLAKLHNNEEKVQEIEALEANTQEEWCNLKKENNAYYIDMFFSLIIWVVSIGSIIEVL